MINVIIPPVLDWGFLKQLPQQIAGQFAKNGYTVHFANVTLGEEKIEEVEPNLFVYSNYNQLANLIYKKKLIADIVYTTWAKNHFWKELCNPKKFIYHSCDIFSAWETYEPKVLESADIVLCTSEYIYDVRSKQHNNVYLVRNGVNSDLLNGEHKIVEDVRKLDDFIVAFVGAIGEWVDTELIEKVANKYTTVFLGKEFGKKCPDNVINLGCVNHDELINYYNSVDAFLLPFDTSNEITLAACPIKLYEYMSTGKPIISTSWRETELFNQNESIVFTSNNKRQFLSNVDFAFKMNNNDALKSVNKAQMRMLVREHTWEKRFEQINDILENSVEVST